MNQPWNGILKRNTHTHTHVRHLLVVNGTHVKGKLLAVLLAITNKKKAIWNYRGSAWAIIQNVYVSWIKRHNSYSAWNVSHEVKWCYHRRDQSKTSKQSKHLGTHLSGIILRITIVLISMIFLLKQVLLNVGLCIALKDIVKVGDSIILPGDGASHTEIVFRYIVFRPRTSDIITGKIRSCSREGVHGTYFSASFVVFNWIVTKWMFLYVMSSYARFLWWYSNTTS